MAEDITERLERTFELLKSRGAGPHASWVREAITVLQEKDQEITALREEIRILKHESGTSKEPFSHSEEKGIENLKLTPRERKK